MKSFREFLNGLLNDFRDMSNGQPDIILIKELQRILGSLTKIIKIIETHFFLKKELNREQPDSLSAEDLISNLKKLEHYINFQDQQVFLLSLCLSKEMISGCS